MDYKGDRIMDYDVWYLASGSDKFQEYMLIPLSKAGRNATACVEWLVSAIFVVRTPNLQNVNFRAPIPILRTVTPLVFREDNV